MMVLLLGKLDTRHIVFTGRFSPIHSGDYVAGHFNNLASVIFLPLPRSPAKSMRELRSPPLYIIEMTKQLRHYRSPRKYTHEHVQKYRIGFVRYGILFVLYQ
jgi:nicotinic acid mononucleotide adenylyltransferase